MEALQNIRILQGKQKNVLAYPKCFHCTFLCGISGYGTSDSITESTTDTESDEVAPDKMIVAKTMEDELSELIEPGAVR